MTLPGKVVAFLDFFGEWDPTLAFVMGGALMIFGPTYFLVRKRRKVPVLSPAFDLPTKTRITGQLVVGATIFGAGRGLGGFCPGTVITSLPTLSQAVLLLFGGIFVGILLTWGAQTALEPGAEEIPHADF
jgi:uncharacterized membrane protein YedE/YeeE